MEFDIKAILITLSLIFLFVGCRVVGLYSGYNSLSQEEKSKFTDISSRADISNISTFDSIYLVTPESLKSAMQVHRRNVIYLWDPLCSHSSCIHPSIVKAEVEKKGYKFWLISVLFQNDLFSTPFNTPVYGIKESIERKTVSRYLKNFMKEIGCEDYDFESFVIFKGKSHQYLDDILNLPH